MKEVERTFKYGLGEIREYEQRLEHETPEFFENNRQTVIKEVESILKVINSKRN